MENLLLRCLRLQADYSPDRMAECLEIDVLAYLNIERGCAELTAHQQDQISTIFKTDPQILKTALLQSKLFRTSEKLITRQKWVINMLIALVRGLTTSSNTKH
jgi:DNA-binding XRE family transcriptional regulator